MHRYSNGSQGALLSFFVHATTAIFFYFLQKGFFQDFVTSSRLSVRIPHVGTSLCPVQRNVKVRTRTSHLEADVVRLATIGVAIQTTSRVGQTIDTEHCLSVKTFFSYCVVGFEFGFVLSICYGVLALVITFFHAETGKGDELRLGERKGKG